MPTQAQRQEAAECALVAKQNVELAILAPHLRTLILCGFQWRDANYIVQLARAHILAAEQDKDNVLPAPSR